MSPASAKARIFISHSAKEPEAQAVQAALVAALEAPERTEQFGVLLDRVTLKPGDMWRSRINLWVGGCDAAVILLSNSAMKSAYVAYETSVLSYRVKMGDPLLLLPVLLEDVDPKNLAKSRLSPMQLGEFQVISGKGKAAEAIAAEVVARLEKALPSSGKTPIERRARELEGELQAIGLVHLREAARFLDCGFLGCTIDEWIPNIEEKFRLRLAIQLLSVGMEGAIDAILSLRENLPSTLTSHQKGDWMQRVIQNVACSWVDTRSSEQLSVIAKKEGARVPIGLNARSPFTMAMYVHCARCQDQFPKTWHHTECDGVVGMDRVEQVVAIWVQKLERVLAEYLICRPEDVREELVRMNSWRLQAVVVALPGEGINTEILQGLRRELPLVTFFLLLGDLNATGPQLSEEEIEILFPELLPGDENRFVEDYKNFRATLRPRKESWP